MKDTVIIVDGNNIAYANSFTHRDLEFEGKPTGMLHGMMVSLLKLAYVFNHAPMVIVWDGYGENWRKVLSGGRYKGNRTPKTEEEKENSDFQKLGLFSILLALKIPSLRILNVEADDLIGILSEYLSKELGFEKVIIRSGDRDFYQLLDNPAVKILPRYDQNAESVTSMLMTVEKVRKKFGVAVKDWLAFRALTGDDSDGLLGLKKGCGEAMALNILMAGVRPPVKKMPMLEVPRYAGLKVTFDDWKRVNENFVVSRIWRKVSDVPKGIDRNAVEYQIGGLEASLRRRRLGKSYDQWAFLKLLGRYGLVDLGMQVRELEKIF